MLTLNILPDNLKKDIKLSFVNKKLNRLMLFMAFFLLFYGGILITARTILSNIYSNTTLQLNDVAKNTEKYSEQVNNINNEVSFIQSIQKDTIYWLPLLEKFSYLCGPDIKLQKLTLSKEKNLLSISGTAPSPESLLNFKDNLEKTDFLKNIDLPLKLLFTKGQVDFNISATITNYEIK